MNPYRKATIGFVLASTGLTIISTTLAQEVFEPIEVSWPSRASVVAAAGVGDVNGDGINDVAFAGESSGENRVWVLFGDGQHGAGDPIDLGAPDFNGFRVAAPKTDSASNLFGTALASAGDVNGDGLDDIIVGDPVPRTAGRVYIIFGRPERFAADVRDPDFGGLTVRGAGESPLVPDPAAKIFPFPIPFIPETHPIGTSVAGVGDLNGDGLDDFAIGNERGGQLFVIFGATDLVSFATSERTRAGERLQIEDLKSVFSTDLNADGMPDLLINGRDPEGQSAIIFVLPEPMLASVDNELVPVATTINTIGLSGARGRPVGDINGDGIEDVATVGFAAPPRFGVAAANTGRILPGGALEAAPAPIVEIDGGFSGAMQLEPLGDLNGDGLADVGAAVTLGDAAGAVQRVEAYVLVTQPAAETVALMPGAPAVQALPGDDLLQGPTGLGDINGDGAPDMVLLGDSSAQLLLNRQVRDGSAVYRSLAAPGRLPEGVDIPGARTRIGFDDGSGPQSGPSLQSVVIDRRAQVLEAPVVTAPVAWTVSTDRSGWQAADVEFQYLQNEVVGMAESALQLYLRRSDGTLKALDSTVDSMRNRIQATTTELGQFVVADTSLDKTLTPLLAIDAASACPGFFVARAETLRGQGRWGLSVELREGQSRLLHGGVNAGGGYGGAGQQGFVAVNLGSRQRVEVLIRITPNGAGGPSAAARLDVIAADGELVDSAALEAGNNALAVTLDGGFHTFRIRGGDRAADGLFEAQLIARSLDGSPRAFQGGVHVGGLTTDEAASRRGYAAFCVDRSQRAHVTASGRETFGVNAVEVLRLQVLDRDRQVIAEI